MEPTFCKYWIRKKCDKLKDDPCSYWDYKKGVCGFSDCYERMNNDHRLS